MNKKYIIILISIIITLIIGIYFIISLNKKAPVINKNIQEYSSGKILKKQKNIIHNNGNFSKKDILSNEVNKISNEVKIKKKKKIIKKYKERLEGIINNIIYSNDKKIGYINHNKIFLYNNKKNIYSFDNIFNINNLYLNGLVENTIYYDSLTLNLPMNNNFKPIIIIYKCNGPLIKNQKYEYCKTNKKDYLTQYEFGMTFRGGYGTGGGYIGKWRKIYIIKIGGKNIVFEGLMGGIGYESDPWYNTYNSYTIYEELLKYNLINDKNIFNKNDKKELEKKIGPDMYKKMRNIIRGNKYLDILIKKNIKKDILWEKTIKSFKLEKN